MRDIIEPLTLEQLIDLAHKVKGIVCGVPWAQGEVGEDYDSILRGDVTALVIDDETGEVILDCGEHDHGPEIAAAIVAMRNSFPVLFNMARDYAKRRAETFEALELLAQAVQERNAAVNALRSAEWKGVRTFRGEEYWPCCPECRTAVLYHGNKLLSRHKFNCKINAAINAATNVAAILNREPSHAS